MTYKSIENILLGGANEADGLTSVTVTIIVRATSTVVKVGVICVVGQIARC